MLAHNATFVPAILLKSGLNESGMETHLDTYLSPYVHNLLVTLCQNSQKEDERTFLHGDLTLDWSAVSLVLGNFSEDFNILDEPSSWYESTIKRMWPVYLSIHAAFSEGDSCQRQRFQSLFEWTEQSGEIVDHYSQYEQSKTDGPKLKLILYLTSVLERSLGNVYSSKKTNVPFLLRDLLNTPELKSILGIIPTTFIQLLVGTPRGLNLRNVAWHGFVKPSEVNEALITVLIVVIASIQIILSSQASVISIPRREYFKLAKFDSLLEENSCNLFGSEHLRCLVNRSTIIHPAFKPLWLYAIELVENSRYGECCIILLAQSELLLRCVFCAVNSCSSRLLTAEAETLYTTFDHILLPQISGNDGRENELYRILTVDLITMLNDLFSFAHGPRLRDKLSHAEIKLNDISSHLCRYFIHVLVHVILKLNDHFQLEDSGERFLSENQFNNYDAKSVLYYPKFHLVPVVKRSILKAIKEVEDWNLLPHPEEFLAAEEVDISGVEVDLNSFLVSAEKRSISAESELVKPSLKLLDEFVQFTVSSYDCSVFQNRELMIYLMQTVEKISEIHDNVKKSLEEKYLQWRAFKLRERGRNTYAKILQMSPLLRLCLLAVLYVIIFNFTTATRSLDTPNSISDLKAVFAAVQNIHHYTDSAVNRWLEISNITRNVIQPVLQRCKIEKVPSSLLS